MVSGVVVRDDALDDEAACGLSPQGSVRHKDGEKGLRPLSTRDAGFHLRERSLEALAMKRNKSKPKIGVGSERRQKCLRSSR